MENVDHIIEIFGNATAMARALGHKRNTTVFAWKKSGRIPHWRHPEIWAAAERIGKGKELSKYLPKPVYRLEAAE